MLTVCTGWSPSGWEEYGQQFAETFARHWKGEVRLLIYVEEKCKAECGELRFVKAIPGVNEFFDRHKGNKKHCGRSPTPGWNNRDIMHGYNYRYDAMKFCRQAFIPLAAAQEVGEGLLCWLDGDVRTYRDMPVSFIEKLLPEQYDAAYLGRLGTHSEIGFQLYRLPQALPLLQRFRDTYATDKVFELQEWHSAFVFDYAREKSGVRCYNLTPNGRSHVWFQSPLGHYLDHLKGDTRKRKGYSAERPT